MIEGYREDAFGAIKRIESPRCDYGSAYQSRLLGRGEGNKRMACLRYAYLVGTIGRIPFSVLDIGYGDGEFLRLCHENPNIECFGYELDKSGLPEGCTFVADLTDKKYDVICFFDSLEHFENLDFLGKLQCNNIYITLPNCAYKSDEWFRGWKHRKPQEHVWNFSYRAITQLMGSYGYEAVCYSYIENMIRHTGTDIITIIFKKDESFYYRFDSGVGS